MDLVNVLYLDGDYAETGLLVEETSWRFSVGYEDGKTETFEKDKYTYEVVS